MITVHPPHRRWMEAWQKRSSVLCDNGDLELTVASHVTGRRTMPLTQALASDPVRTVTLATNFPPSFLQEIGGPDSDVGNGGGVGFRAYGRPTP